MKTFSDELEQALLEATRVFKDSRFNFYAVEPVLLGILDLIKRRPECHVEAVRFFVALVDKVGARTTPGAVPAAIPVLEFCMRELQWPEVREKLEQRLAQERDPSIRLRFLRPILAAYEESGFKAYRYRHYSGGKPGAGNRDAI